MFGLKKLLALETVFLYVLGEVVQNERIHEVHDILHTVCLDELGVPLLRLIDFVQTAGEQQHEHENLVEERRIELSSVDFD